MTWVIGGEIFPDQIRELGMGISAAIVWMCGIILMTVFPLLSAAVGQAVPFLVLAMISLLSAIFVVLFLAETKGLPLDEICSSGECEEECQRVWSSSWMVVAWWLCTEN